MVLIALVARSVHCGVIPLTILLHTELKFSLPSSTTYEEFVFLVDIFMSHCQNVKPRTGTRLSIESK